MSTNLKANSLTVKSFRGISKEKTIGLENVTIVYGVNGTGKSSFVNSLEYLFTGELSFLKKSTINKNKSSIHKNSTKQGVKIELDFDSGDYIKLTGSKKDFSDIFSSILKNPYVKNASFILNRAKLLQFIEGTQGKRYDAVLDLIGIKKLNTIESNFSSTASGLKKEYLTVKSLKDKKIDELSIILTGETGLDYHDCMVKLNNILENNGEEIIIRGKTDLDEYMDNLDISSYTIILNKLQDFNDIYQRIDLLSLSLDLNKVVNDYQLIASDNLKSSQYLVSTLKSSIDYFELTNSTSCPICKNDVNPNSLLKEIKQKVEDINESSSNFNSWKNNLDSLIFKIENQIRYCEHLNEIINDFNKLSGNNLPSINYSILSGLKNDLEEFLEFKKVATDFTNLDFTSLDNEINSIKQELDDYETNKNISELSNLFYAISKVKEIDDLNKDIHNLKSQYQIAEKTFNIFKKTKQEFINNLIMDIREDIKYFYEYIHGDDGINSPDIVLSDSKKIDVYLDSFGDVVDSRSFASEGHLDTLGICIFLAFNKKFNVLPLVVLDDVFTTVDVYHKEKIARLLVEELSDCQFIITAHNQLWIEQLQDVCLQADCNYVLYELIGWSLEEGPIISL